MLLRRANCLVAYWREGEFIIENYLTGRVASCSSKIVVFIQQFDMFVEREVLGARFPLLISSGIVDLLIESNILLLKDTHIERRDAKVDAFWQWGIDARFFHFSTSHTQFECNDERVWVKLENKAQNSPPPSPFLELSGKILELCEPLPLPEISLNHTLSLRRTCRDFSDKPINSETLSSLLYWTWGYTHLIRGQDIGDVLLKTSPSGGARHPIEVFLSCSNVTNIPNGIYHYSVNNHCLTFIKEGDFSSLCTECCFQQLWIKNAPVVFFMIGNISRIMWKYEQSHAYRVLLMDAGHLGQTFHLVATSLKLGPFTTAAIDSSKIGSLFDIDIDKFVPIYCAATGFPQTKDVITKEFINNRMKYLFRDNTEI